MPVYNVGHLLERCIESVLKNNCSNCELILVDDGSTDGVSGAICDAYSLEYPDLIISIHTQNGGPGAARNVGIKQAKGQYLLFVDSDDYIKDGYFDAVRGAALKYQCDIIQIGYQIEEKGRVGEALIEHLQMETVFTLSDIPTILAQPPSIFTRVWKKSLFQDNCIYFPEHVWYEDLRATLKLLAVAERIVALPCAYYVYVVRDGSIMHNNDLEKNAQIIDAFDDLISWYKKSKLLEKYYDVWLRVTAYHILVFASVRVAKYNPNHPLLFKYQKYMNETFPNYKRNETFRKYRKQLPKYYKLMLFLSEKRLYHVIYWLYKIKEKRICRT